MPFAAAQSNVSATRQQRNIEKQQTIVMTYSNAVPRVGSAQRDKKKMAKTFYDNKH